VREIYRAKRAKKKKKCKDCTTPTAQVRRTVLRLRRDDTKNVLLKNVLRFQLQKRPGLKMNTTGEKHRHLSSMLTASR
ncbi:hypothetical protein MKW98_003618, partial [Papaver atlanticum]